MKWHVKSMTSDKVGLVRITAESEEDMWHVYNLVEVGDRVMGSTFRKVVRETSSGATSSDRHAIRLSVTVSDVSFDSDAGTLRVSGRNGTENEFVRLGAYHTLELEPHRTFELEKDLWDSVHFDSLKSAAGGGAGAADVMAITMDAGIAYICAISGLQELWQRLWIMGEIAIDFNEPFVTFRKTECETGSVRAAKS